jgi:hypothetical protein
LEETDHGHRLHVPGAVALINLDASTCTPTVQRIFAAR